MRPFIFLALLLSSLLGEPFDTYLKSLNYDERPAMKIKSAEAMELYTAGKAVFIDIRFKEEYTLT